MEQQINELRNEISQLRNEVSLLISEVKSLKNACSRMDGHITFVENVYDKVRHPINTVLNYVQGQEELPRITSSEDIDISTEELS
jgi:uncharacterized coiled-coil DUF342 family protein